MSPGDLGVFMYWESFLDGLKAPGFKKRKSVPMQELVRQSSLEWI